jgi:hypothetical protein
MTATTPNGIRVGSRIRHRGIEHTVLGIDPSSGGLRVDIGLGYSVSWADCAKIITVDDSDPCAECDQPLSAHDQPHPYVMPGLIGAIVGNDTCAQRYHHSMTTSTTHSRATAASIAWQASHAPAITIGDQR